MGNESKMCENSPKRQKTLRKQKSIAEPSTSRLNTSDLEIASENSEDFESSGEYGDITWKATQSDLDDYDENVYNLSPMEQKITIATKGGIVSGGQSQYVTLCSATTVNEASEQTTVSHINDNSSNIDASITTDINTVQTVEDIDVNIIGEKSSSNFKLYTTFTFGMTFSNANQI